MQTPRYEADHFTHRLHPACHCLLCSALLHFPSLAGCLWGESIFSWEALVSQCSLTSLDALSCRFPLWPHHIWQTLTKPQICTESSFWFLSSVLPVYAVSCTVDGKPLISVRLWLTSGWNVFSCFLSTTGVYGWGLTPLNPGKKLFPVNAPCSV